MNLYGRSACEKNIGDDDEDICEYIEVNCFGPRISQLDVPIEAEWELVDDGSAIPSQGCNDLIGFTPGNIALIRRGGCEFGIKAFNAEITGATAAVIVNDGQCSDDPPSESCVMTMGPGQLGGLVTIPMVMLPMSDGEQLIAALDAGETIRGVIGGASRFSASSQVDQPAVGDTDPDASNDGSHWVELLYGAGCSYTFSSPSSSVDAGGGAESVDLVTTCPWTVSTDVPWITLYPPTNGTGDAAIDFDVSANHGSPRAAGITAGNVVHHVLQQSGNGCTYTVSPLDRHFMGIGGEGAVELTTQNGCAWTASTSVPWMSVSPASTSGVGSGAISYSVATNPYRPRDGAVYIADQYLDVFQQVLMGCDYGLVYDDGSAENGYGGWGNSDSYVQLITPEAHPYAITDVCAAFTRDGSDADLTYQIVVYDTSGPDGSPGNLIASIPAQISEVAEFPGITFDSVDVENQVPGIIDGSVYVGVEWDDSENGFYIAVDESPTTPQQIGYISIADDPWLSLGVFPDHRSLFVRVDGLEAVDGVWTQVVGSAFGGGYGFGDPSNQSVWTLAGYDQALFAGTINMDGCEIHSTTDGTTWTPGDNGGLGGGSTVGVVGFAEFHNHLYATTVNLARGGSVYRTGYPPSWSQVAGDGFGGSGNASITSPVVFSDQLFVGTANDDGAEVWRSPDGVSWTRVADTGFGNPSNDGVDSLTEFGGALWAGVSNSLNGAEVWRSQDGATWTRAADAGFGDQSNSGVDAMAEFEGRLYAGVANYESGAQIWRSADGVVWEQVMAGGLGNPEVDAIRALHTDGGQILASTSSSKGTVIVSDDGLGWRPISSPGFNNPSTTGMTTFAAWNGMIYIGTSNDNGGEIWRGTNPVVFFGGFESGTTSAWDSGSP